MCHFSLGLHQLKTLFGAQEAHMALIGYHQNTLDNNVAMEKGVKLVVVIIVQ